ncbi:hypothetical protein JL720_1902 [Aureococcus anophagefferens]|nr:hypothetical protein JL720_1902 [Aureococcus anophagefferens]
MSLPISHVTIFKKTGLVLWSRAVEKMRGDPVSQLIQNYLLEEKGGAARRATIDAYDLEWRFVNEGDLVVVVASQRSLELDFCGDLVDLRNKRLSAKEAEALDFSGKAGDADARAAGEAKRLDEMRGTYLPGRDETAAWDEADELTLTRELVDPAMEKLRTTLMEKNVAVEVADAITATVSESLVGKKVERFARAKTLVRDALKDAVARVLTPKRSTDVLREVLAAKKRPKGPYSIVFVGINGVGKSTSLSKVAYYLKEHGVDVMITACDTFRSGAVEQLRSHAKCLDVELYEKGYLKDPGDVAKASLDHAESRGKECVLIDTAGRMQNNERLMRELAKLISVNSPDLVLFVGEALVGNDGIDQLNMFNKSLAQFCPDGRQIDGLVLTKFDTIDDKVGATLSMTDKTGQPIMFIGVGQKYTHLKKLSVNAVINALFSS